MDDGTGLLIDVPPAVVTSSKNSVSVLKMIGFDGPIPINNNCPHTMREPLAPQRLTLPSSNSMHAENESEPKTIDGSKSTDSVLKLVENNSMPTRDVLPVRPSKPMIIIIQNENVPKKSNESTRPIPVHLMASRPQTNDNQQRIYSGRKFTVQPSKSMATQRGNVPKNSNKSTRKPLPALLKIPRPIKMKSLAAQIIYQRVLSTDLTLGTQLIDCDIADPMISEIPAYFGCFYYSGDSE